MHREFGIVNSYTLEVSFCGPNAGAHKDTHFTMKNLRVSMNPSHFCCEGHGHELLSCIT